MRQSLTITRRIFLMTLKNKATLVMMFVLPLLFTVVFGAVAGGTSGSTVYPVALVDQDRSFVSARIAAGLGADPLLQLQNAAEADLTKLFADKAITAAVVIPAEFQQAAGSGAAPEVKLIVAPGGAPDMAVGPAVNRVVSQVAGDWSTARRMVSDSGDRAKVEAAYAKLQDDRQAMAVTVAHERVALQEAVTKGAGVGETAVGFTVLFMMMTLFNMGGVILQERKMGTWGRLLTTPTSRVSLMTGYVLSFFVTGMFQFGVLVAFSAVLFQIDWGPLLPLAAVAGALVLCAAGMGLFMAGIVRTAEQQQTVGTLVVNATCMLGGVYWPLELVGDTMRTIGYLTPQAWAMDGFREVMLRGGSWSGLTTPLAVLLSLAAIFMAAGLTRVRFE